jgi:hypothetical protein
MPDSVTNAMHKAAFDIWAAASSLAGETVERIQSEAGSSIAFIFACSSSLSSLETSPAYSDSSAFSFVMASPASLWIRSTVSPANEDAAAQISKAALCMALVTLSGITKHYKHDKKYYKYK